MKAKSEREFLSQLQRDCAASHFQVARMFEVLRDYILFREAYQLNLAETATIWTIASLARHERRAECQALMFANVDVMYAATDHAEKTLSESERNQLIAAANAVQTHLVPAVNEILSASVVQLLALDKDNVFRRAGDLLNSIRETYLEHAAPDHLRDLILACGTTCLKIDIEECGLDAGTEVIEAIASLCNVGNRLMRHLLDLVKQGTLIVQDGKLAIP